MKVFSQISNAAFQVLRRRKLDQQPRRRQRVRRRLALLEALEQRRLLAVTASGSGGDYEIEVAYDAGQTILDLPDLYFQTDADGNLEYSTSETSGFTDLVNVADESSIDITVQIGSTTNDEFGQLFNNLFGSSLSTVYLNNIDAPGVDLSFSALDIRIPSDAVVSTRDLADASADPLDGDSKGDSGSLTLDAPRIKVSGSLLTHVPDDDAVNSPGLITIEAIGNLDDITSGLLVAPLPLVPDISITRAQADFDDATIKGGDVFIKVDSDASDLFDDEDSAGGWGEPLQEWVGGLSLLAGGAISQATADLNISGGTIEGDNVTLKSNADSDAEATVLSVYLAVAYGQSEPTATIDVTDGAQIIATGDLSVTSEINSDLGIFATQNLIGTSSTTEKYNITLNGAYSNMTSKAKFADDTIVTVGGDFLLDLEAIKNHNIGSNAAAYGDGTLATALNVGVYYSTIEAHLDGVVDVTGDMTVHAELDTLKNDYAASSTLGTSGLGQKLGSYALSGSIIGGFQKAFGNSFGLSNAATTESVNDFDVAASINVGLAFNSVDVRIGDGAQVSVDGNLTMRAIAEEFPETSAITFFNTSGAQYRDGMGADRTVSARESALAGAITAGYFENDVDVTIGDDATVVVGQDLTLESDATVPYYFDYDWDSQNTSVADYANTETLTDRINYNLGIQNAFFTSWAEATAAADEQATGLMFNVLITDSSNSVTIGDGADITVGGDMTMVAETVNDTINFVGSPLILFNATGGQGIGAATMLTGYFNDTTTQIKKNAKINAGSLLVFSNNRGRNISIGVQGGLSDGPGGFNGAFSGRFVDNRTIAKISSAAELTLGNGQVAVPLSFDTLGNSANAVTTDVPQFNPAEPYDASDSARLRLDSSSDTVTLPYAHGLSTGDPVVYDSLGGDDVDGLTSRATYYAIVSDGDEIGLQLAVSYDDALAGTAIDLGLANLSGATDQFHSLYPGINPTADGVLDVSRDEINTPYEHDLVSGQAVRYDDGGGSEIGNLTSGEIYYVIVTGPDSFKLATTSGKAVDSDIAKDDTDAINLTSGASGVGHSFVPISFASAEVLDPLRVLDSNDDGDVTTADEFVVGFNSVPVFEGPRLREIQTNLNLLVIAEDNTESFSGTGAVTKTTSSGGGLSVSTDVIVRNTEAFIGEENVALDNESFTPGMGVHSNDLIVLDYDPVFRVGDQVTYTSGTDFPVGGLRSRGVYEVTEVSGNAFRIGRAAEESTTTFGVSAVNDDEGVSTIDLGYDHGFQNGDAVVYEKSDTDTGVSGLEPGETYYVIAVDDQSIALALTIDDAINQDLYSFTPFTDISDSAIFFSFEHELEDGQALLYKSGGGSPVGGLDDGDVVFVDLVDDDPQAITLVDADGEAINLDPSLATGIAHTLQPGFDVTSATTVVGDSAWHSSSIDLGYEHGLVTGDPVRYESAGGVILPAGVVDDTLYYAIAIDETKIALTESFEAAEAGRERFFATFDLYDNGDATDDNKFDTVDVYTEHGYRDGDQLVFDQLGDENAGLTDGATYTVRLLDDSTQLDSPETKFQLLDADGNLVELTQSIAEEFGRLLNVSVRQDVTVSSTESEYHFIRRDDRIALDATSMSGTYHSIRLSLDPQTTTKSTHGFGFGFDPSLALSDSDSNDSDDMIDLGYDHGFSDGQAVTYSSGQGKSIAGINESQVYFVRLVDGSSTKIQLTDTFAQATEDTDEPEVLEFDASESTGTGHAIASVFRPVTPVDVQTDAIDFGRLHGFSDGDEIRYDAGGGTAIDGLIDGKIYRVIFVDSRTIQLSELTSDPALAIDLDPTTATGTDHRFIESSETLAGQIVTQGGVGILSASTGQIISVTVAGTIASSATNNKFTGAGWASTSEKQDPAQQFLGGNNYSGALSVNVIVDRTRSYAEGVDLTSGGGVYLDAVDDVEVFMGAGAVTIAKVDNTGDVFGQEVATGSNGMAGSFAVNVIATEVDAFIDSSLLDVSGPLSLDADSMGTIIGLAISGSGASGALSVAGAIAVNVIAMNTGALINDSSVETDSDTDVKAYNSAMILGGAGTIATTLSSENFNATKSTSFGAGISINVISNDLRDGGTTADIVDSELDAAGDVTVKAETVATIGALAAGFAINTAGGVAAANAVSGSVGVNVISTRTRSAIRSKKNGKGVTSSGDVDVKANDTSLIVGVVGAIAYSGNSDGTANAVGLSFSFNTVVNDVHAKVTGSSITADSLSMDASTDGSIISVGVAAAFADDLAGAGQITVNWTSQQSTAEVVNSQVFARSGDVLLDADNNASILSISGGLAVSTGANASAVGAALSVNIIADKTIASIDSSMVEASNGSVEVHADSDADIFAGAIGYASGKQVGVGGSITTNVLANSIRASIEDSTVLADHNLTVMADHKGNVSGFAGGIGEAKTVAGVGGALSISIMENETLAYIDRSAVEALGNGATTDVPDWNNDGTRTTQTIHGLAVIAADSIVLDFLAVAASFSSGGAGVAVNLAPTFVSETTHAFIQDSDVNRSDARGCDVVVRSHQKTDFLTFVGQGSYGGAASVGISAGGIFVGNDTQAYIAEKDSADGESTVYAGGDLQVETNTLTIVDTIVVGANASKGAFAGTGSVDLMMMDNSNQAYLSGVEVGVDGDLSVTATDNIDLLRVAGGVSGAGAVGSGATVIAVNNSSLTEARILNSTTNASGTTLVEANTTAYTDALMGSLAVGGKAAFNGTFALYISTTETRAVIESDDGFASVNQDDAYAKSGQSVEVRAKDDVTALYVGGGASATFGAGVAGTLLWLNIQNTVDAHIGAEARVSARGDLTVEAISAKVTEAYAGGLSLGLGTGLVGTFLITSIGSGIASGSLAGDIDDDITNQITDSVVAGSSIEGLSASETPRQVRDAVANASTDLDTDGTIDRSTQDVAAFIGSGAVVTVGGDLTINAEETLSSDSEAGTAALAGGVGAGAAVAISSIDTVTEAYIAGDSTGNDPTIVAVSGDVTITANASESVELDSIAAGGSIIFALGAQYTEVDTQSDQTAAIGAGVNLLLADDVSISAGHTRDLDAVGTAAAASGAAVGLSASIVDSGGDVEASVGGLSVLGQSDDTGEIAGRIGSLDLQAHAETSHARAKAPAMTGGILIGVSGAIADATVDPSVTAAIGTGAAIYAEGGVTVQSSTEMDAESDAVGNSIAGGASFGVSDADTLIAPTVTSEIRPSVTVDADSITVNALHNTSATGVANSGKAKANASSSGGALILTVNGSHATAKSEAVVELSVFDATLNAATGNISLSAHSHNAAGSDAFGDTGAIIGVGLQTGDVKIDTSTKLTISDNATLFSEDGSVSLVANSADDAVTNVEAGTGGVVAVSEAESDVDVRHQTSVKVGDGVFIGAEDTITIQSTGGFTIDDDVDAQSIGGVGVPTASADLDVEGPGGFPAEASTDIGASELTAEFVEIIAEFGSIDIESNARAEASAVGVDADGRSRLNINASADVLIREGARISGGQQVDLLAQQSDVGALSKSRASTEADGRGSLVGVGRADSAATLQTESNVTTESSTRIVTQVLNVSSLADPTLADVLTDAEKQGTSNVGPKAENTLVIQVDRVIDFNSNVTLLVDADPILEFDSDGNEINRELLTYTEANGAIIVDDLINAGSLGSEVNLIVNATDQDSEMTDPRQINGTGLLIYKTAFEELTIRNASAKELQLGRLDVNNESATLSDVVTTSVADIETFNFVGTDTSAATTILVETGDKLVLAGEIENIFGTTTLISNAGEIVSDSNNGLVETAELTLSAPGGSIGMETLALQVKTSSETEAVILDGDAAGDIWISVSGDQTQLYVLESTSGDVSLESNGTITDVLEDALAANVIGAAISVESRSGSIGSTGNALEIDSSGSGTVNARSSDDIVLTELNDSFNVGDVYSSGGNILLTALDQDIAGQDFLIADGQSVDADSGDITIIVGDDFVLADGGTLEASGPIEILLDQNGLDVLTGSAADFLGTLRPSDSLTITGGDDGDTINVRALDAIVPVSISTGLGADTIDLGSITGELDFVREFLIDAGEETDADADFEDRIILDDSGTGATEPRSISMSSASTAGYDLAVEGFSGSIEFAGAEQLDVLLGAGNDIFTLDQLPDSLELTAMMGSGDDEVLIGSGASLDAVFGTANFEGESGTDQIVIDDSSETADDSVTLTASTASWQDTGGVVGFGGFESIDVRLGSGSEDVVVSGTNEATTLELGAGDDTVEISGNSLDFEADLEINGRASDRDAIAIAFTEASSFTVTETSIEPTTALGVPLGNILYQDIGRISASLGDGEDTVRVKGTRSEFELRTGGGADTVEIASVAFATTVDLGTDPANDSVTILDAESNVTVTGDVAGADTLTVDRSGLFEGVSAGRIDDTNSGVISGVTTGAIAFDSLATLNLLLGFGTDHIVVDAGSGLAGTDINIDGGGSNDQFEIVELSDDTTINGGEGNETVTVTIPSFPIDGEFSGLGLNVELLKIDSSASSTPTAWSFVDASLTADNAESPTGTPVTVIDDVLGIDRIQFLGGTAEDTLTVGTETINSVDGTIDTDAATGLGQVDLNFGSIILEPGRSITFDQAQSTIDFDAVVDSASYEEDGLVLTSTGDFASDPTFGSGLKATTDGQTMKLEASGGGGFLFDSIDLALSEEGSQSVNFVATTLGGQVFNIGVVVDRADALTTFGEAFTTLNQTLESIAWNADSNLIIDNIVAVSRIESTMTFDRADRFRSTSFQEAGYELTSTEDLDFDGRFSFTSVEQSFELNALNGEAFTLHSIDIEYPGTTPVDLILTGTTLNGIQVTETIALTDTLTTFQFSSFRDVTSIVSIGIEGTGISPLFDRPRLSQGVIESVAASESPTPVLDAIDPSTLSAQSIVFNTGELNNADTSDDVPTIEVDGDTVTEFNGTPFSVQYLDADGNVIDSPDPATVYMARYTFEGDFVVPDGSSIGGSGDHALSIIVENNAFLGEGVTFDVAGTAAEVVDGQLVGGAGGQGAGDGGDGGSGGVGGDGSVGGDGGRGGSGGEGGAATGDASSRLTAYDGDDGGNGLGGRKAGRGDLGGNGEAGTAGTEGFNGGLGGEAGLLAGLGGDAGAGTLSVDDPTTSPTVGGVLGEMEVRTGNGGGDGGPGGTGDSIDGNDASPGTDGNSGTGGENNGSGLMIAAGGGGGGGAGGGGGGGGSGGSGGSGGGGGGGGGGYIGQNNSYAGGGGAGGSGGGGGGTAGSGGDGGDGGAGGGGGGAFEIFVRGVLSIGAGSSFDASGGDGAFGFGGAGGEGGNGGGSGGAGGVGGTGGLNGQPTPTGGEDGDNGETGLAPTEDGEDGISYDTVQNGLGGGAGLGAEGGFAGLSNEGGDGESFSDNIKGGDGGEGGDGFDGGDGGDGAAGGVGGHGGGGAGGTVKLFGTSLQFQSDGNSTRVSLFAAGGDGSNDESDDDDGQRGRILLGDNDDSAERADTDISSGRVERFAGPTSTNPYLDGNVVDLETPYIPNLIGGAQVYGFLDGVTTTDIRGFDFDLQTADIDSADADAIVAIFRLDDGLAQIGLESNDAAIQYAGYDWIVVANLTNLNLAVPTLGLGVHSGSAGTTTGTQLAFDDLASSVPTNLSALDAGAVWVTLVPETTSSETLLVDAGVGGNIGSSGDLTVLDDFELANDSVAYITSGRSLTTDLGPEATGAAFTGLEEIATAADGEILAITETRDALLVIDGSDYSLLQVVENQFDGVTRFEDARGISATDDGKHVYVQVGETGVAVLSRDADTGLLSHITTQDLDVGVFDSLLEEIEGETLDKFIFNDFVGVGVGLFSFTHTDLNSGVTDSYSRLRVFTRDESTGLLTAVPFDPTSPTDPGTPLTTVAATTIADIDSNRFGALYALNDSQAGDETRLAGYFLSTAGLSFNESFFGSEIGGADTLVVNSDQVHVISKAQDYVVTFDITGDDPVILQTVTNGVAGVSGIDGPVTATLTDDKSHLLIAGQESDSIGIVSADGSGALQQRFVNNSSGVSGLHTPTAIIRGAAGGEIVASSLGDENNRGGLTTFVAVSDIGNALIERDGVDDTTPTFHVLDEPFPDVEGIITQWRFVPSQSSAADGQAGTATPVLLERNGDSWTITAIGAQRQPDVSQGSTIQSFDFDLVAGSSDASGKYFGWFQVSGPNPGFEGGIDWDESGSTIRLDTGSGGSMRNCRQGLESADCDATYETEATVNRAYSIQASFEILEAADAVRAQFADIDGLTVQTAGGTDSIVVDDAPGNEVTSLRIETGDSEDQIDLYALAATTDVYLGDGADDVEIKTTSDASLRVFGNAGSDTFDLALVGNSTTTRLNGNNGDDTFYVAGVALGSSTDTTINGGNPDDQSSSIGDTLVFNPGDPNNIVNPADPPRSGQVGIDSPEFGLVDFSNIEVVSVEAGPVLLISDATLTIAEGDDLDLTVTIADVVQNSGVSAVTWEFPGGSIEDTSDTTLSLSWDELKSFYGVDNGDEDYLISVSATNDLGIKTTEFITLSVTDTLPTIRLVHENEISAGDSLQVEFEATDFGNDELVAWTVDWGNGSSPETFSGDVAAITHAYNEPGSYSLNVTYVHDDVAAPQALTANITVNVDSATLSAGGPYMMDEGDELELSATYIGTPISIAWDLNDDGDFGDASGDNPTLTWEELSALSVDDSGIDLPIAVQFDYGTGTLSTIGATLDISNVAPTGQFELSANFPAGGIDEGEDSAGVYGFGFTTSEDPSAADENAGLTYSFDIGDNGWFDFVDQTAPSALIPSFWTFSTIRKDGVVPVRGRITDKDGDFSEYVIAFVINDVAPTITLVGEDAASEGETYSLSLTGIDPGFEHFVEYEIDWGDGSDVEIVAAPNDESTATFSHEFKDNTSGDVVITVTARDQAGAYTAQKTVSVANVGPQLSSVNANESGGSSTIVEGDTVSLRGLISDPGIDDDFTLDIAWGDGTTSSVPVDAGETSFVVVHRYDDDGTYAIVVTITDKDGASAVDSINVTVENVSPTLAASVSSPFVDEGETLTVSGTISDVGIFDTHLATIDWGDGFVESLPVVHGAFSATHEYSDDDPTGTGSDSYSIVIVATDSSDSASTASVASAIDVNNRAPEMTNLGTTASTIDTAVPLGDPVVLTAEFQDFSGNDTFSATIDWGDGNLTTNATIVYDVSTLEGTISASHNYTTEGIYEPSITISDDDLGQSESSSTLALVGDFSNVAPMVDDQTFGVDENSSVGTVVGTVVATDSDANSALTYEIAIQNEFTIDPDSGELSVATSILDAEARTQYLFEVTVTDQWGESDSATITVDVGDINEYAPQIELEEFLFEIDEFSPRGTLVTTAEATDLDATDSVTFSLDPDTPFTIDPDTGAIAVSDSSALDFGTSPQFSLDVIATDQGGMTDVRSIVINLREVEDAPVSVSTVKVSSTSWTDADFLSVIDPTDGEGYLIAESDSPTETISWSNVDTLLVKFGSDVASQFDQLSFHLKGVNVEDYPLEATYDAATRTARVSLDAELDTDKLRFIVADATQIELYSTRFDVLPGDLNHSGATAVDDIGPLRASLGYFAGEENYDAFADINGSGSVAVDDIGPLRNHIGIFLPDGEPGSLTSASTGLASLQSFSNEEDVNLDGSVSPRDALTIINLLARTFAESEGTVATIQDYLADVSGDGQVSPLDALRVINRIAREQNTDTPEGESPSLGGAFLSDVELFEDEEDDLLNVLAADVTALWS